MDSRDTLQLRLGAAVRAVRGRRGVSVESAAKRAGLSPVTWRRIEHGHGVYGRTVRKLEAYLALPEGAIADALEGDEAMAGLEDRLADLEEDASTTRSTSWLESTGERSSDSDVSINVEQLTQLDLAELERLQEVISGILAERYRVISEEWMRSSLPRLVQAHRSIRKRQSLLEEAVRDGNVNAANSINEQLKLLRDQYALLESGLSALPVRYYGRALGEAERLLGEPLGFDFVPSSLARGLARLIPFADGRDEGNANRDILSDGFRDD